jgi:hypothetical protein
MVENKSGKPVLVKLKRKRTRKEMQAASDRRKAKLLRKMRSKSEKVFLGW